MNKSLILIIILSFGLLTGCIAPKTQMVKVNEEQVRIERLKQQRLALTAFNQSLKRLFRVSYPLRQSAIAFCEDDQSLVPGFLIASRYTFKDDFHEAAKEALNLDQYIRIAYLLDGTPAKLAGLQVNDRILSVNQKTLGANKEAISEFYKLVKAAPTDKKINITLERNKQRIQTSFKPQKGCSYGMTLSNSDAVNAYADGRNVIITRGMMRFAQSDQELALVVSHELAHNAMSHITAKQLNSLGGTLLDIAAAAAGVNTQGMFGQMGALVYSQAYENEADYVGLYIMARAGLKTDGAANFWRRMAVEHPASISSNHSSTHPATAERFIAIETTIDQIDQKKRSGMALMPEMKK